MQHMYGAALISFVFNSTRLRTVLKPFKHRSDNKDVRFGCLLEVMEGAPMTSLKSITEPCIYLTLAHTALLESPVELMWSFLVSIRRIPREDLCRHRNNSNKTGSRNCLITTVAKPVDFGFYSILVNTHLKKCCSPGK